jgi:hypothetical protein
MQRLPLRLGLSGAALVAANLMALVFVALGWWSTFEVMLLFWAENVVIGLLQLLRFGALALLCGQVAALGVGVFFAIHYGIFTLVHGTFVVALFAQAGSGMMGLADTLPLLLSPEGLLWGLGGLAASHLLSFLVNFLGGGEYRRVTAETLMAQPYGRVVVLHLAILLGGGVAMLLNDPVWALVVLVLLKIVLDLRAHLAEHRDGP